MQIADRWFGVTKIDDRITLLSEPHVCRLERCNIWHIRGRDHDLLIDSGIGVADLSAEISKISQHETLALATHSHNDHVGSLHQFAHRMIHSIEAEELSLLADFPFLCTDCWPAGLADAIRQQGYEVPELIIDALPFAGFSPAEFRISPCKPTRVLEEGDVIDLGDAAFEVLHLPGHSPGSIGLWEAHTRTLFSGDAIYDGPLLDEIPGADKTSYRATMERLLNMPVDCVHAGHDPSFDRTRLQQLARQYLDNG